jgi:predicted enzyme related to lactoylglutathione lyase
MLARSSYPTGVPCWVDLTQVDYDRATQFYADLFGWVYEVRTPPDAPFRYAYARLDGMTVGAVGGPSNQGDLGGWTTYVRVESVDESADAVTAHGGKIIQPPMDIPRSGRVALAADPHGAVIGLWEPAELHGVELVNAPGSWNFSELHTPDPDSAIAFYGAVFGWVCDRFDMGEGGVAWLWRRPGYGEFLAASDPEIRERQAEAEAPGGFADAVAWMEPFEPGGGSDEAYWTVTFAVGSADSAHARALELGAVEVTPLLDTAYTRQSSIRDPQGAHLTLSEYRPPES